MNRSLTRAKKINENRKRTMKKYILFFAAAFGFAVSVSAQNYDVEAIPWDSIVTKDGDVLRLYEDAPGKIVIDVTSWRDETVFPVIIKSVFDTLGVLSGGDTLEVLSSVDTLRVLSGGDTLEVLNNADELAFGIVTFQMEPEESPTCYRTYRFSILDSEGRRLRWWPVSGYKPGRPKNNSGT